MDGADDQRGGGDHRLVAANAALPRARRPDRAALAPARATASTARTSCSGCARCASCSTASTAVSPTSPSPSACATTPSCARRVEAWFEAEPERPEGVAARRLAALGAGEAPAPARLATASPTPNGGRMTTTPTTTGTDFKVADLSLAEFGRKEIQLAEHEMPGLMATARGVRRGAAAQGRAHHRLAAHDDPDRRPDRDARRARRRGALGVAATSSRPRTTPPPRSPSAPTARPRPAGHPGLRLEGRDARGVLVVHRAGARLAGRRRART